MNHPTSAEATRATRRRTARRRVVFAPQLLLLLVVGVAHAALLGWVLRVSDAPVSSTPDASTPFAVALVAPPPPPAPAPRRPAPRAIEPPAPPQWSPPARSVEGPAESVETPPVATAPAQDPEPTLPVSEPLELPEAQEEPQRVAAASPPPAALPPPRYAMELGPFPSAGALEYKVYLGDYAEGNALGRARILVESDGRQYRLRNEAELVGLLSFFYQGVWVDQSRGRLGPDGPEPLRYSEWRRARPERAISLDYNERRVVLPAAPGGVALEPGAQDRLSVIWLLGMVARANPQLLAAGRVLEVPLLSFRGVRNARFESRGDETLRTDAGVLRALHVAYRPRGEDGGGIEVWLGYDRQMQPVRIRYRESDRKTYDMVLER